MSENDSVNQENDKLVEQKETKSFFKRFTNVVKCPFLQGTVLGVACSVGFYYLKIRNH